LRDIRATRLAYHGQADDLARHAARLGSGRSGRDEDDEDDEEAISEALAAFGLRMEPE